MCTKMRQKSILHRVIFFLDIKTSQNKSSSGVPAKEDKKYKKAQLKNFFCVCLSYAHDHKLHNGRCYNYGCPKLTSGLTEVKNYEAVRSRWMAASVAYWWCNWSEK